MNTATIYKDSFFGSKPWTCDVKTVYETGEDGPNFRGWTYARKTRRSIEHDLIAVFGDNVTIVRGEDR